MARTQKMQFLLAISHSLGAHTEAFHDVIEDIRDTDEKDDECDQPPTAAGTAAAAADDDDTSQQSDDCCEVCLIAPRAGVALVPWGHSSFCTACSDTVASMDSKCPICRSRIKWSSVYVTEYNRIILVCKSKLSKKLMVFLYHGNTLKCPGCIAYWHVRCA